MLIQATQFTEIEFIRLNDIDIGFDAIHAWSIVGPSLSFNGFDVNFCKLIKYGPRVHLK